MTTSDFDADRPPEPPGRRRRRRRDDGPHRDPNATVPPVEFTSYYGNPVVKPVPWKDEIAAYVFVGGVTGGSGLIGCWAHTVGLHSLKRNARWSAMIGVGVSGALLISDLGHPERFLNMMRTVKLTSPMSVGSWILSGFGTFAAAALGAQLSEDLGIASRNEALSFATSALGWVGSCGSAAFAAPLVSYTAVLLSDTASPLWHESYRELPWVFVFSANAAAAGLAMILNPPAQCVAVRTLAVGAVAVETIGLQRLERRLSPLLIEPLHHGRAGKLERLAKVLTIGGAVGTVLAGRNRLGAMASGAALLAGSACTRFAVFHAGIESAKDPKYTVIPQRERVRRRHAAGNTDGDITTVN